MKKVEAVIRADKLEDLKAAVLEAGFAKGMTIEQVLGFGQQKGAVEIVRGHKVVPNMLVKVKVEIVIRDAHVEDLIDVIVKTVKTGDVGDGKIFVSTLDDAIRIRTGERGPDVL